MQECIYHKFNPGERRGREEYKIPGKLRARPVQHPATPALVTVEK